MSVKKLPLFTFEQPSLLWKKGIPKNEIKKGDWYIFAYKHYEGIRYICVEEPSMWYFENCDTVAWRKLELYEEKS